MAKKIQKPEVVIARYWQIKFHKERRFFMAAGGAVGTLVIALGLFNVAYAGKIFPGVVVGSLTAGGLTPEQLAVKLDRQVQSLHDRKLPITIDGEEFVITPTHDWELSYDIDRTVEMAWGIGRQQSLLLSWREQLVALLGQITIATHYRLNNSAYEAWLAATVKGVEIPEQDAHLSFKGEELVVEEEKIGRRIPNNDLENKTRSALATLNFEPITISLSEVRPALATANVEAIKEEVGKLLSNDLILTFDTRTFTITAPDILGFLELAADPTATGGIVALISEPKVMHKIESIAQEIDRSPVDAKLRIENGRATIFTPSRDGFRVKRTKTAQDIADAFERRLSDISVNEVALTVEIIKPAVRTETINDLGIKELVGKGTTSFAGSPQNRIHNITVGAASFNGLLIKPGETFSTIAALGQVDASTGYRAELVIKEDRLIPETGGGLCQVSTTLFRAVLSAGLEIVERKNHSFRVRYYEPPIGMDATIYDPAPDLKFRNDTPGYILIQTKIEGTKLTFEFYGTKDGRVATTTTPLVYNITSPGDPVYIEDSSLAPGETKQIEKAVPGADARFTYTVKRDGKIVHQKTFTSHYVAWKAKYLIGPTSPPAPVEPTPPPAEPTPATEPSPSPTST
jgi:vancomycin resistance protein YoaR